MRTSVFLVTMLILLAGCSDRIRVHTDFDKSVDIRKFKTYRWLDKKGIESRNDPFFFNELNDKRIKTAANDQMTKVGYKLVDQDPELILHYHIVINDKTVVDTEPYGYYYGAYWMRNETNLYRYREGTLIIDIMDAKNSALLWRGWAVSVLDDTPNITDALISESVAGIFGQFPAVQKSVKN